MISGTMFLTIIEGGITTDSAFIAR